MKQLISYKWVDLNKDALDSFSYLICTEHFLEECKKEFISPHQQLIVPQDYLGNVFDSLQYCYTGFAYVLNYPLLLKIIEKGGKVKTDTLLAKEIFKYTNKIRNLFRVDLNKHLAKDTYFTSTRGLFGGNRMFRSKFEIIQYKGDLIRIPTDLFCALFYSILYSLYEPKEGEFVLGLPLTVGLYQKEFPHKFTADFLNNFTQMLNKENDFKKILFVWDKLIKE